VSAAATTAPLPSVAGFTPAIALPASNASANTTIAATSSTVAPAGLPVLQSLNRRSESVKTAAGTASPTVYLYESLTASSTITFNGIPGFSLTLPSTISTSGLDFYIAVLAPGTTQWQLAALGPAQVNGQTIAFPSQSGATATLPQGQTLYLAFYSVPAGTPTPTPAPSTAPTSAPQSITLSPTSLSFLATGSQYAQTFTATQSGNTSFTTGGCTNVASVTANTNPAGFTVTPQNAGTCTITVTGSNNQTATLQVTVTTTTVGGQ
jgi:hypothetical protein